MTSDATEIKRMDIKEFREFGFLQEANRQFFHPLGLALEIVIEDDGTERLGGIWDYRDDPEGVYFGEPPDGDKAVRVYDLFNGKADERIGRMDSVCQPVGLAITKEPTNGTTISAD